MSMDENMQMQKKLLLFPTLRVPFGSPDHKDDDTLGSIINTVALNIWKLMETTIETLFTCNFLCSCAGLGLSP